MTHHLVSPIANGVERAVRLLRSRGTLADVDAVLLFGSYESAKQDSQSDVDLILIHPSRVFQMLVRADDLTIDVVCDTFEGFRNRLNASQPDNNNFILNILLSSKILVASSDKARKLQDEAREVYSHGPPGLSDADAAVARNALIRMKLSAEHLSARAVKSDEDAAFARFKMDRLVLRTIYLYFKAKRQWTSSFHATARSLKAPFPDLYELWLGYVAAASARDAFAFASAMVDIVLAALDERDKAFLILPPSLIRDET